MADDVVTRALLALGLDSRTPAAELAGSQSGSGVYLVRADGRDAVLKLTTPDAEPDCARRELTFYRTLAGQVPVETPDLLGYVDDDQFTVLLLTAHAPPRKAIEWVRDDWLELARQLAALHEIPRPTEGPWFDHRPWIRDVVDEPRIRVAEDYWSRTEAAASLDRLLGATPEFAAALDAVPDCFVHGDCHVDNLLRDGDRIVWTDWQVAGIGSPASDLAFVGSRANADGADVPYDAILHEYASHRGIDPDPLRRAIAAAELGTLLFGWPDYVEHHTSDERDRLTHRMLTLAAYWNTPS